MSVITNIPKIKNPLVRKVREQLEHRAMWLALLCDEAEAKGLDYNEFGRSSTFACGCFQGKILSEQDSDSDKDCDSAAQLASFKTLKKNLFSKPAQWMFEMDIKEVADDHLSIDFHYCPLVKAWQKMGYSDEKIAKLCDTAMCGDRGIASQFGGQLNLEKVIAKGDPICQIRFRKTK
ncbi:MAG: L-2-amino-thiazoline-4-carboxylic acid hydrolase [Clostridia bacterium]